MIILLKDVSMDTSLKVSQYKIQIDIINHELKNEAKEAKHKLTGEKVAVKIMYKDKLRKTNDLPRVALEVQALKALHHHGITRMLVEPPCPQ